MGGQAICGCLRPENLPDLMCGACGCRRIGDDLTPQQLLALTMALSRVALQGREGQRLHRVRGRKRPDRRT